MPKGKWPILWNETASRLVPLSRAGGNELMFRFMFGAAVATAAIYSLSHHPDLIHQTVDIGREQLELASENISGMLQKDAFAGNNPLPAESADLDDSQVQRLVPQMRSMSTERLWRVMDEDDFNRRAAAACVLLHRSNIPATAEGVKIVQQEYLLSGGSEDASTGFSYLGLLAYQDVPETEIVRSAKGFVESHPQDPACDHALWALGELGSEQVANYLFGVISQEWKYSAAARERAFCCLSRCGRYVPEQRQEMIPRFIEVYDRGRQYETRLWSLQAMALCAPHAQAETIEDWRRWWATR